MGTDLHFNMGVQPISDRITKFSVYNEVCKNGWNPAYFAANALYSALSPRHRLNADVKKVNMQERPRALLAQMKSLTKL